MRTAQILLLSTRDKEQSETKQLIYPLYWSDNTENHLVLASKGKL